MTIKHNTRDVRIVCDLTPNGFTNTPIEVTEWSKKAAAKTREKLTGSTITAYLWSYRYNSDKWLSLDLKDEFDNYHSIGFSDGCAHNFNPVEPMVPDFVEALHMVGMVLHILDVTIISVGRDMDNVDLGPTPMKRSVTIESIDPAKPITISAFRQDLDHPILHPVDSIEDITIEGNDVKLFLLWLASSWRPTIEKDLQSLTDDPHGCPLLTNVVPLVTFRQGICGGGRSLQDLATRNLMERLQAAVRNWRSHEVDIVDITGYWLK